MEAFRSAFDFSIVSFLVNRKLNCMDNDGRWIRVDNVIASVTRESLS